MVQLPFIYRAMWFGCGVLLGLSVFSAAWAAIPPGSGATYLRAGKQDPALVQKLSEIHVRKVREITFDRDIRRLLAIEDRYQAQEERELSRILARKDRVDNVVKRVRNVHYIR